MNLSVIIVFRNSHQGLRRCIGSLWQHCGYVRPEVIVIDNSSSDRCDEMLAREFPSIIRVRTGSNLGLARGNNLGAERATRDNLLFLHPDTEFIENALDPLLTELGGLKEASAVGCQLINPNRTHQAGSTQSFPTIANQVFDSEYLRERFPHSRLWGAPKMYDAWQRHAPVDVVSTVCLLVRRNCFMAIGGFSEYVFVAGCELDVCYKLMRAGRSVYFVPGARIVHFGGLAGPSPMESAVLKESVYQFLLRARGQLPAIAYRIGMTLSAVVRLILIPPLLPLGAVFVRHGRGSWLKWFTVLRWSVGRVSIDPAFKHTVTAPTPVDALTESNDGATGRSEIYSSQMR